MAIGSFGLIEFLVESDLHTVASFGVVEVLVAVVERLAVAVVPFVVAAHLVVAPVVALAVESDVEGTLAGSGPAAVSVSVCANLQARRS